MSSTFLRQTFSRSLTKSPLLLAPLTHASGVNVRFGGLTPIPRSGKSKGKIKDQEQESWTIPQSASLATARGEARRPPNSSRSRDCHHKVLEFRRVLHREAVGVVIPIRKAPGARLPPSASNATQTQQQWRNCSEVGTLADPKAGRSPVFGKEAPFFAAHPLVPERGWTVARPGHAGSGALRRFAWEARGALETRRIEATDLFHWITGRPKPRFRLANTRN